MASIPPSIQNVTDGSPTLKNLDAWKKAGANIQEITDVDSLTAPPKPPLFPPIKRMKESSSTPEVGSFEYTVNDAFKCSQKINEEYSASELCRVVDNILEHIKDEAKEGFLETPISTTCFNIGMKKAVIKELKHRGFKVKKVAELSDGVMVSWDRRWKLSRFIPFIALLLILLTVVCFLVGSISVLSSNYKLKDNKSAPVEQKVEMEIPK